MAHDSNASLPWILVVILALLLVLTLPTAFVWHIAQMQRLQEEAEVLRREMKALSKEVEHEREEAKWAWEQADREFMARMEAKGKFRRTSAGVIRTDPHSHDHLTP